MIKSSPFGGTTLTGEDAEKFHRQIRFIKPNPLVKESLKRGLQLIKNLNENSTVTILLKGEIK